MMAIFTGMPSVAAVISSWLVIWNEPSPSMAYTSSSGRPALAPIAAGTAKPIVPRPPELIQRRGSSKLQNWDAHIWCWPTPDTTMASPPVSRWSSSTTYCGLIGPSGDWS